MPTPHVPLCETLAISDGRDANKREKTRTSNYVGVPAPYLFISSSEMSTIIVNVVDIDTGIVVCAAVDRGL